MADPRVGYDTFVAFGDEATWATEAARSVFLDHMGMTPNDKEDPINFPGFRERAMVAHGRGLISPEPQVVLPYNYTGFELLLYHIFGDQAQPAITTPGGGTLAREQAYVWPDADASYTPTEGLTMEARYGKGYAIGEAYKWLGCVPTGFDLEISEDNITRLTVRFAAKSRSTVTVSTPTFATRLPSWWHHWSLLVDSVAVPFRSLTLKCDLGMEKDRREVSSRSRLKPVPNGKRKVEIDLTSDLVDRTIYDYLANDSIKTFVLTGLDPDANSIETGQAYMSKFNLPNCHVSTVADPIDSAGIMTLSATFVAEKNSGLGSELQITNRNKVTAVP